MDRDQLTTSKAIQRKTGVTFHLATRFFPNRIRHPTYVMYAFFRIADDVVDDPNPDPPDVQQAELDRIREAALGNRETDEPVLQAFDELRQRYDIPDREIREFIHAMEQDIDWDVEQGVDQDDADLVRAEFADVDEMVAYFRGSAVAVAYMMLAVMNPDDPELAKPHARALGEAFQLTNFLRDVREDVLEYQRVYLPSSTLDAHSVDVNEISQLEFSDRFADAMREELDRAEELYREGVAGIQHLPCDCQFPVLLAAVLYAEHHRRIEARGYDVLSERPSLTTARRLAVAARTLWHWKRSGDPEASFYRASAVSPSREQSVETEMGANVEAAPSTCRISSGVRALTRHLGSLATTVHRNTRGSPRLQSWEESDKARINPRPIAARLPNAGRRIYKKIHQYVKYGWRT